MLVGRDAELAVLDSLTARTRAGAGGVVLLTGEPGVGKTRLARAATERAVGAVVSWGACRESEGAPPLWPWTQVLRRLGVPPVTAGAAAGAEGAAARYRLYEQVADALAQAAGDRPHLVVIDDLHRADEASLRLLGYLGETLWPAPVGMIVTYRDTEVAPASLAAEAIAGLAQPGQRRAMAGRRGPGPRRPGRAARPHRREPAVHRGKHRAADQRSPAGRAAAQRRRGDQGTAGPAAARLP